MPLDCQLLYLLWNTPRQLPPNGVRSSLYMCLVLTDRGHGVERSRLPCFRAATTQAEQCRKN